MRAFIASISLRATNYCIWSNKCLGWPYHMQTPIGQLFSFLFGHNFLMTSGCHLQWSGHCIIYIFFFPPTTALFIVSFFPPATAMHNTTKTKMTPQNNPTTWSATTQPCNNVWHKVYCPGTMWNKAYHLVHCTMTCQGAQQHNGTASGSKHRDPCACLMDAAPQQH